MSRSSLGDTTFAMFVRRSRLSVVRLVIVALSANGAIFGGTALAQKDDDATKDGKTVDEWIKQWDIGNFQESQKAKTALAEIGKPAVPALTALIRDNHRHAGYAARTLAEIGPAARPAIAEILKLGGNKDAKDPAGWTWNMPIRPILFTSIHKMSWAADDLIPMLKTVASDEKETDLVRGTAVNAMRGMGPNALPALRVFSRSNNAKVRQNAVNAIVQVSARAWYKQVGYLPTDHRSGSVRQQCAKLSDKHEGDRQLQ